MNLTINIYVNGQPASPEPEFEPQPMGEYSNTENAHQPETPRTIGFTTQPLKQAEQL